MDDDVGERLRALRVDRGCSLSELARRSGIGKGTISELENNRRGARLDTLFALTRALDAPLGAVLPDRADGDSSVHGDSVDAVLIDRFEAATHMVEVYRASISETVQHSNPHASGVEETVTVIDGRVVVGSKQKEIRAGESHRYRGDEPHLFRSAGGVATVLILMHYPLPRQTE
ncbi:helix-turn-helix domain-containing protein (plasmid) [Rhodococcoides fascians A25f]|uniref:helix-turn-helix domain-containing protein n=1 Tax=Rhodococcoides fascians TaxID=1828 RepID=UPI000562EE80|nr:XRE family transcriptional regulator [Rhodococcus fascians]QII09294.1 helix-turn-helix domain-containing protein [Rhodococcus fascians A25f]